jgi:hypothetical protein
MLSADEITGQYNTLSASLQNSVQQYRKSAGKDAYGHSTETPYLLYNTLSANITRPSATQLQLYGDIIGSQRALVMKVMTDADIIEGSAIQYDGVMWMVHGSQNANAYSVTKLYVLTVVT